MSLNLISMDYESGNEIEEVKSGSNCNMEEGERMKKLSSAIKDKLMNKLVDDEESEEIICCPSPLPFESTGSSVNCTEEDSNSCGDGKAKDFEDLSLSVEELDDLRIVFDKGLMPLTDIEMDFEGEEGSDSLTNVSDCEMVTSSDSVSDSDAGSESGSKDNPNDFDMGTRQKLVFGCPFCERIFTDKDISMKHTLDHLKDVKKSRQEKKTSVRLSSNVDKSICQNSGGKAKASKSRTNDGQLAFECTSCAIGFQSLEDIWEHLKQKHGTNFGDNLQNKLLTNQTNEDIVPDNADSFDEILVKPCFVRVTRCDQLVLKIKEANGLKVSGEKGNPKEVTRKRGSKEVQAPTKKIQRQNTSEKVEIHSCPVCHKVFRQKGSLNRHFITHFNKKSVSRDKDKLHNCPDCGKGFSCKAYLDRHVLIHRPDKPFKCEMCGISFLFKERLQNHLRIHSRNGRFKCIWCKASFSHKNQIGIHKKRCQRVRKHFKKNNLGKCI